MLNTAWEFTSLTGVRLSVLAWSSLDSLCQTPRPKSKGRLIIDMNKFIERKNFQLKQPVLHAFVFSDVYAYRVRVEPSRPVSSPASKTCRPKHPHSTTAFEL